VRGDRWAYFSGGAYPLFGFLMAISELGSEALRFSREGRKVGSSGLLTEFGGAVENMNLDREALNLSVTGSARSLSSCMVGRSWGYTARFLSDFIQA
jgi:hypothetical protein